MKLRLGTRPSALARTQSGLVVSSLSEKARGNAAVDVSLITVTSDGDNIVGPIERSDKTGVFVAALRVALVSGEVDLVVHSLKDMPTEPPPDLELAAILPRGDVRDALCSTAGTLAELPAGARVGTSAPRRAAQILAARPDVEVVELRGNVDTRLAKLEAGDYDAVVLALAGLERLGRTDAVTEILSPDVMMPAPGQGALAIEIRTDASEKLHDLVAAVDDADARAATTAERAALATLEAGCTAPVGAYARVAKGELHLHVRVMSRDGSLVLNDESTGPLDEAEALGRNAGRALLGRGAARLLSHA